MVTVAIKALELEYLVKILDWGRSRSRYIFSPTPTPPKNSFRLQLRSPDYQGNQIRQKRWDSYAGEKKCITCFGGETWERPCGRPTQGWMDNINMDPKKIGREGVD
jgi:hypothetical protein